MGMTLAEADALPLAKYSGLFYENNYRFDPKRAKDGVPPPDEAFVLEQMRLHAAAENGS